MANYAELDKNNIVIRVIPGVDEAQEDGELLYYRTTGNIWKRTSYNTQNGNHLNGGIPFRKNYAGIGYTYDRKRDAFIPPKPFNSWVLDENTCQWKPPIDPPEDLNSELNIMYNWNEETQSWDLTE
jgi:hypothetical protein